MKKTNQNHSIDLLFLMVVFLVFTFSAVSVLLLAINSYRQIVDSSEEDASARAAVAYIREVIHQNDSEGIVYMVKSQGTKVLVADQGEDYVLMIYEYEGNLCELYTKSGSGVMISEGTPIMPVQSLDMSLKDQILKVDCTDEFGNSEEVIISLKSKR